MKFSIVIPAYNYGHVLERAVRSACTQTGVDDYEVLVIDDGSSDDTAQVLARLMMQYAPRLNAIFQENRGLAAVRNRGVDETQGDYLVFLDADDELLPTALSSFQKALDEAESAPALMIAPPVSVFPDGKEQRAGVQSLAASRAQRCIDFLEKRLRLSNGSVAMHRDVFQTVRYNAALRQVEDIPVFARILANFDAIVVHSPVAKIYKHEGSMRHNVDAALKIGLSLVEEIFGQGDMPVDVLAYRQAYEAQRCLSLSRQCFRAGRPAEGRRWFHQAVGRDWRALLKSSYTLKYLRSFLR